jgi:glycosyltransferase involved in cell wall biosynthesis
MKILWSSNAPWAPSGYGSQTNIFVQSGRLGRLGHTFVGHTNFGLQGSPQWIDNILWYPAVKDPHGNTALPLIVAAEKPDIVITLYDTWIYDPNVIQRFPWAPWFPVDHDPPPQPVVDILKMARFPIAYSKFGVKAMADKGLTVAYVPHGVETDVFKPIDRAEARKGINCPPDVFLVGMVAANNGNPSRKAFDQQIQAFSRFHARHADSLLYIHTDWWGGNGGVDIPRLVELAGLDKHKVAQPPMTAYLMGAIDQRYMNNAYNAMDVLMNATMGEGFGIPIIEAQSAGCPAIVTDYTAMPELVDAGAGWKVGYEKWCTPLGSYQAMPHVDEIDAALEKAYEQRKDTTLREQARAGMVAHYDADHVTETFWKPTLQAIALDVEKTKTFAADRKAKREALRAMPGDEAAR